MMSENGNNGREPADGHWDELDVYCSSDLLSEEGLREIIERHGFTSRNDNGNFNNYDFFFRACQNERVDKGIIRCLLEYFPTAASATDGCGRSPLHFACANKIMTRGIIQLLIDAAPDSVGSVNDIGHTPLHILCANDSINEAASIQLLKFLMEKHPDAVRNADNEGSLPIHMALATKSPEFCQVLIEAYPGSERISNIHGALPLKWACGRNTVETVEYLYKLYPDAINHASTDGYYPIHAAIHWLSKRSNPESAIEIVQYLLDCDPNVKFQKWEGMSLLDLACLLTSHQDLYNDTNIDAALEAIKVIYDAHPEAIEDNIIAPNIQHFHKQVQAFINNELVYARQAKDHRLITTPDGNGRLPLHNAIQNNARLGSIKLLVKGNPSAIRSVDDSGSFPLHVACQHHESTSVVKYLVSLAEITLDATDRQENTALHYACRGARHEIIAMLLETYDAVSVCRRNTHNKLPIDFLWESDAVEDRESIEYTDSVFRLLSAYPETIMS